MNGPSIASLANHCDFELPQMRRPLHEHSSLQGEATQTLSCSGPAVKSEMKGMIFFFQEFTEQMKKTLLKCCQGAAVLEEMAS